MRLAATAAAIVLAAAGAARADDLLARAIPCRSAADQAMCLLKVSAAHDGGSDIWRDADLRRAAEVLSALGLTAASVAGARGANDTERMFFGAMDEAAAAVDEAIALDRAGRPPSEALAPILDLGTKATPVPLFFAGRGEPEAPRPKAFRSLLSRSDRSGPRPSPALARAAAYAWERELSAPGAPASARQAAYALALAYRDLGDAAGVDRALALLPYEVDRLHGLIELGRLEEAGARIAVLTRADLAPDARKTLTLELARIWALQTAAESDLPAVLAQQAREAHGRGDVELAKLIEGQAAKIRKAAPPPPRLTQADIDDKTDEQLRTLRDRLIVAALKAGRPEAARPLADRLLNAPDADVDAWRFVQSLKVATPAQGTAALEARERSLTLRRGAERLGVILAGWRAIGRPERAAQLVERVRPWAAADAGRPGGYANALGQAFLAEGRTAEAQALATFPPEDLLKSDVTGGKGMANLDAYLAAAPDESGRIQLLVGCSYALEAARQWAELPGCYAANRRWLTAPTQRHSTADRAIASAALAADAGDAATARTLLDLALAVGAEAIAADPASAEQPHSFYATHLIAVAKAELRAEGRLAPVAPPSEQ